MNILEFFQRLLGALPGTVSQGLIWGVMAIGLYITYRILDVADLSVDGSFATGGAVAVMLIVGGCPLWLAMLIAFLAGVLAGAMTGILHTLFGIPAILAGILTQLSLYAINLKIMGKANQAFPYNSDNLLISLGWIKDFTIRNPLFMVSIIVIVVIAILYWFFGTEMGCGIRATGANLNMSRAQGINTNLNKLIGIMLSNGIVALSGALLAQYQGFADIKMGTGAIVIGLAAVIIGEAIFGKIFKNFALRLVAVVLGSIIYYIVLQTVIVLGFDSNLLKLLQAMIVAIFLAIPYWKKLYNGKHAVKAKGDN